MIYGQHAVLVRPVYLHPTWNELVIYAVSQKNIRDIFDCNLKTNYQSLIIFDKNIPVTTCH